MLKYLSNLLLILTDSKFEFQFYRKSFLTFLFQQIVVKRDFIVGFKMFSYLFRIFEKKSLETACNGKGHLHTLLRQQLRFNYNFVYFC